MEQPRPNESLRAFLERRERELTQQISAIFGQLGPRQAELREVRQAMTALGMKPGDELVDALVMARAEGRTNALQVGATSNALVEPSLFPNQNRFFATKPVRDYGEMTIKELVVQSLLDHFPNGTTAAQIREFIRDAYGRPIEPSTLRPQMHRLKADGVLEQNALSGDIWNLNPAARLGFTMYDHPTSRKAMKALQDDPPDSTENALNVLRGKR